MTGGERAPTLRHGNGPTSFTAPHLFMGSGAAKFSYIMSQRHSQLFVNKLLPPLEQEHQVMKAVTRSADAPAIADNQSGCIVFA